MILSRDDSVSALPELSFLSIIILSRMILSTIQLILSPPSGLGLPVPSNQTVQCGRETGGAQFKCQ